MATTDVVKTPAPVSPAPETQVQETVAPNESPKAILGVEPASIDWADVLAKAPKDVLLKVLDLLPDQDFVNHKRVQSEADRRSQKVIDDSRNALNRTLAARLQIEREEATIESLKKLDPEDLSPKAREWMENRAQQAATQQATNAALTQVWSTVVGPRSPIRKYIGELPTDQQAELMRMATQDRVDPGTWLNELMSRHALTVESRVRTAEEKERDARVNARLEAEMANRRQELPAPDLGTAGREGTVVSDNDWLRAWGEGNLPSTKENFLKADELLNMGLSKNMRR